MIHQVSIIFVVATYFFVLSCYPTEDSERDQIIPPIAKALFGERAWVNKVCPDTHCSRSQAVLSMCGMIGSKDV
jgi:hypothetical protein